MDDNGSGHPGARGGTRPPDTPGSRRQEAGFSIFLDLVIDDDGEQRWESRLYHAETGSEAQLQGISPEDWIRWLFDQLGSVGREAATPLREPASSTLEVAGVEIIDVRAEPAVPGNGERQRITARVIVELTGVAEVQREIGSQILRGLAGSTALRPPSA